jgi:hypothetical protein
MIVQPLFEPAPRVEDLPVSRLSFLWKRVYVCSLADELSLGIKRVSLNELLENGPVRFSQDELFPLRAEGSGALFDANLS